MNTQCDDCINAVNYPEENHWDCLEQYVNDEVWIWMDKWHESSDDQAPTCPGRKAKGED